MNPSLVIAPRIIEGPYLNDILAQPEALRAAITGLKHLIPDATPATGVRSGRFRRVVLTGMGSSLFACYPLHRRLARHGVASHWLETAELLFGFESLRATDTLLIAVSQSGESAEIARLIERAEDFGHVIGVTNCAASRLATGADTTLFLHAGNESSVSCKTYLTTLAVLHWQAAMLCGGDPATALRELERAESAVRDYLGRWRDHVESLVDMLRGVESVFVTGRGDSLATAGTGGLILKESTRHHAEGMSCAAFRHGPLEMVSDRTFVVVLGGDERAEALNRRLAADVENSGGRAVVAAIRDATAAAFRLPEMPPPLLPIVEMLPVQMLSLALAALAGREAGKFEHATKITVVE